MLTMISMIFTTGMHGLYMLCLVKMLLMYTYVQCLPRDTVNSMHALIKLPFVLMLLCNILHNGLVLYSFVAQMHAPVLQYVGKHFHEW